MVNFVWFLAQAAENTTVASPEDQISQWVNAVPILSWVLAILLLVGGVLQSVDSVRDWSVRFFGKFRPKKREINDKQRQKLRRQLIDVVLRQVVKRLEGSLHHKIRIDLKREEERQRVGRRDVPSVDNSDSSDQFIRREFNPFDSQSFPALVNPNLSTYAFLARDDIKGRLLILGEPGSGKTNELLAVAKALLQEAKQSVNFPIPVIFELSEWSSDHEKTFADWLSEQLKEKYDVSLNISKQWIEQNQLFPLLDGLDELRRINNVETATSEEVDRKRQAKQLQCMRTINAFLDEHPATSMVVCCRRKEYEALQDKGEYLKRLNGAIYLQELDDNQIRNHFKNSNREHLWDTLNNQPALLELVRSPLFLLMFIVAYQGQPIQTTDGLLDIYIEKQLGDLNNQGAYPPGRPPSQEKTHHYLSWLATKLETQEITEFLIERLQPSWLDRRRDLIRYKVLFGLVSGLSFGLVSGLSLGLVGGLSFELVGGLSFKLMSGLSFWLIVGLSFGLVSGLSFGLVSGLMGSLSLGLISELMDRLMGELIHIQPVEKLRFLARDALRSGLSFGLGSWLLSAIFYGLFVRLRAGLLVELRTGLGVGLIFGLGVGLIFGLYGGLVVSESDIDNKQLPNQGIKRSIKTSIIFGLIGMLLFGLIGTLFWLLGGGLIFGLHGMLLFGLFIGLRGLLLFGLITALSSGLSGGLIFGLIGGLFAVIQHSCLRLVLYKTVVAPWNYARFLEHAENHRFIQRVGGRYRFVHALLQKRFAERYQK